jgi:O-antigen ligase
MGRIDAGGRLATGALLLLPGVLTVYLSFNAGGFFPQNPAFLAIVLALALAARFALGAAPLEGFSRPLAIAAAALALFAVWTLVSGLWSDAPGRAVLEFDRALLYLLALLLFGSIPRSSVQLRWMLRGLALGIVVVSLVGLVTRILPDLWPVDANYANNRLSYPLTYWNSLGLLASIGLIICLHLTSSRSEAPAARVFGAAAMPVLATTLYFTFSRGAIAAVIVGLLAYVALGRPRALLSGLLASAPATAIAVVTAYDADLLATPNPTTAAAVSQGHDVALALALCILGAALARALLLALDPRLALPELPKQAKRRLLLASAACTLVAAVAISLALEAPSGIAHQYDRFVNGGGAGSSADFRTRLTDPANNGRLGEWRVARDAFQDSRLHGEGAGTYQVLWARDRPSDLAQLSVRDAHSLYVEVLGELGIVGLALLVAALGALVVGLLRRRPGPHRPLYAAVLAAALVWLLRAGGDWDWEMPAVTLWLFAVGGAAIAASGRRRPIFAGPSPAARTALTVTCLGLAIVPTLVLVSQTRLDNSAGAFTRGRCPEAVDRARSASSALGLRPEPYEIVAFCELRAGTPERGVAAMEEAIDRDPRNWEYRYGLALARAVAGQDPRPAAREALRLNRFHPEVRDAVKRFRTSSARIWRRRGEALLRRSTPFYLSDG